MSDTIKSYWVNPAPDRSPHLMYGTGPLQMMVAVGCNIDWAKKLRDTLNEHDELEAQLAEANKRLSEESWRAGGCKDCPLEAQLAEAQKEIKRVGSVEQPCRRHPNA